MPHRLGWCLAAGSAWLIAWSASATVLTPTILTDELASPGAGCSLREAVLQANRNVVIDPACGDAGEAFPADTIALASGATYVLSITGEDDLGDAGDLDLTSLLLLGNGAAVEAAPTLGDRLLHVLLGAEVEVRDLTVRGGSVASPVAARGGGIRNEGHLALTGCTIEGNRVAGGFAAGGGIDSSGRLELTDCVVSDNEATGSGVFGGGINARDLLLLRTHVVGNVARGLPGTGAFVAGGGVVAAGEEMRLSDCWFEGNLAHGGSGRPGDLGGIVFGGGLEAASLGSVERCTFSGNVAKGGDGGLGTTPGPAAHAIGGGIDVFAFGSISIENSTFSGNSTLPGQGLAPDRARRESVGAIFVQGSAVLDSVTVTGSSAVGIYNSTGRVTLTNSLVALQSSGGDCGGGAMTSADFNLDSDGSCDLTGPNDQPAVPAEAVGLLPLGSTGGFGPTHALSASSAAFDRGETVLDRDQRGVQRPQFVRDDVGAVEQETFAAVEIPFLAGWGLAALAAGLALAALGSMRLALR